MMQVSPILGRTFTVEETRRAEFNDAAAPVGPNPVVVLAYSLWQQQFGRDPAIVGRTITIERRPFQGRGRDARALCDS